MWRKLSEENSQLILFPSDFDLVVEDMGKGLGGQEEIRVTTKATDKRGLSFIPRC